MVNRAEEDFSGRHLFFRMRVDSLYLFIYKMLYWINWIVLLSLEPLAGELEYASVEWSAAGTWVGRVSNV